MRIYPPIAKALEDGEEVTINYRDFAQSLILDPVELVNLLNKEI